MRVYKGFYYEYMSTLFLFGHIEDTPLARSLVLVPVTSMRRHDREGVMSRASPADALFTSACYLMRLDDNLGWQDFEELLGEQAPDALRERFPDAVESIEARRQLSTSIPRAGG